MPRTAAHRRRPRHRGEGAGASPAYPLKPLERVLPAAARAGVGVIARVPPASGLLSGKCTAATVFDAGDHRTYNRRGESFDVGETSRGWSTGPGSKRGAERDRLLESVVRPAFAAYRDVLHTEIAPHGRPPEHVGLCRLPDGEADYAPSSGSTPRPVRSSGYGPEPGVNRVRPSTSGPSTTSSWAAEPCRWPYSTRS